MEPLRVSTGAPAASISLEVRLLLRSTTAARPTDGVGVSLGTNGDPR
ncbi:MAG: hypothetical protein LC797_20550 [Chloroflexi bacterium]|nr:hypothetical protein [Chloroflexota bacterium]